MVNHIAAHFEHKPSLILERTVFTHCEQLNSKSVMQFVAKLRQCALK